jgi:hypothetical protein
VVHPTHVPNLSMLAVQGTPYVVGAGIYDENAKVEDLG